MGARACGIKVFTDEGDIAAVEAATLPANMAEGKPCPRGHTDAQGRTIRYAGVGGTCIACTKILNERRRGRDPGVVDVDALVGMALARERRAADEAQRNARKAEAARRARRMASNEKGQKPKGEGWATKRTKIKCARRGRTQRISNLAHSHGDPYCSRTCAFGAVAPRLRRDYQDDATDAQLAEVSA